MWRRDRSNVVYHYSSNNFRDINFLINFNMLILKCSMYGRLARWRKWSARLCGASFSNPSFASPTSQLILQPFRVFTYIIAHSSTLPSLHLCHRHFTYVIWRAAHGSMCIRFEVKHSKIFCRSFRICIIILNKDFTINKWFWRKY